MKTRVKFILSFVLVFCFCCTSFGQGILEYQLNLMGKLFLEQGYNKTHNFKFGTLRDDEHEFVYFELDDGWTYKILAVCDEDCKDLDLCLFDENNNTIECDQKIDDLPLISITPRWTGEFKLRIKMFNCEINPCSYGIGIFGKIY